MVVLAYLAAAGLLVVDGIVSTQWIRHMNTAVIAHGVPVDIGPKLWIIIICFGVVSGILSGACFIGMAKPSPALHAAIYSVSVLILSLLLAVFASRQIDYRNEWGEIVSDVIYAAASIVY